MHLRARAETIPGLLVISALFATLPRIAAAQTLWRPPRLPVAQVDTSTPSAILLPRFELGPVTIIFEETPLRTVQRALPGGRIGEAGEADGYVAWLCYVLGSGSDRSVLWLESFEQGGPENAIMGFTLLPVGPTARVDPRCADTRSSGARLRLSLPIRLGTSSEQLLRELGKPTEQHGDTLAYFHQTDLASEKRTVYSNLCVVLRAGRVIRIDVWHFSAS